METVAGINQLATEQGKRRLVVELDVVERIGEDLGCPHKAGLDVLENEKLEHAEDQPANANCEPDLANLPGEVGGRRVGMGREQAEIGRIPQQEEYRRHPD